MKQVQSDLYPRLSIFLGLRGQELKAAFTVQDVAALFLVTTRTIQTWIADGRLIKRVVPGRAKIFPVDLENLLAKSSPASTERDQTKPEQAAHSSPSSFQNSAKLRPERRGPAGVAM